MSKQKSLFIGITSKLAILMGSALFVTGAQASINSTLSSSIDSNDGTIVASGLRKPLLAKLTLKQQSSGFKLIAQHGSHSSHSSHGSHGSHSSHSSRAA